jgi:hypothetical protein
MATMEKTAPISKTMARIAIPGRDLNDLEYIS